MKKLMLYVGDDKAEIKVTSTEKNKEKFLTLLSKLCLNSNIKCNNIGYIYR